MTTRTIPVLLTALALVVTACGDTSTTDDSATTTAPAVTTTSTTTTTTSEPTTTTTGTSPAEQTVLVYFSVDGDDCAAVEGFERSGPGDANLVELALTELLGGPTAEEESSGAGSFFSSQTADALYEWDLTGGLLTVEFRDIRFLNNASTSCGSQALLASLTDTVFQFAEVERVRFTIFGSCSLFWNWLQTGCSEVTRLGTEPATVDVNALAEGSGCTPGTEELPDGRWFGYVTVPTGSDLEFDLACWFSGVGAIEATLEDGEESPPPNDYYIRNSSPETRTVPVASDVMVRWLPPEDIANLADIPYADWVAIRPDRDWLPGVWLEVEGGTVISIEEQYQP
jgi:spore germination protein GerM